MNYSYIENIKQEFEDTNSNFRDLSDKFIDLNKSIIQELKESWQELEQSKKTYKSVQSNLDLKEKLIQESNNFYFKNLKELEKEFKCLRENFKQELKRDVKGLELEKYLKEIKEDLKGINQHLKCISQNFQIIIEKKKIQDIRKNYYQSTQKPWSFSLGILLVMASLVLTKGKFHSENTNKSQISNNIKTSSYNSSSSNQSLQATNSGLVNIQKVAPNIIIDMRYATTDNFMNKQLYPVPKCILLQELASKLTDVQSELEKQNKGLKIFDCYRPLSIQQKMWDQLKQDRPNLYTSNYVADPKNGSKHNSGAAVDLTLVDIKDRNKPEELEMPSKFDDFSKKSHMDYKNTSYNALKNRQILREIMEKYGLKGISTEWWHYELPNSEKNSPRNISLNEWD
jgi:zinc D-Ala-D-Ala dipeptidase